MEDKAKDATTVTEGTEMTPEEAALAAEKKKKASEAEAQKAKEDAANQPATGQSG